MAVKAAGSPLSFSEIETEFGANSARSLGSYRVSQTVGALFNRPLDVGIPQTGAIKFSQFYSKRLNVVVNFHTGGTEYRQNGKVRYNGNAVTVIGGFRGKKEAGSKILIHVNKTIGSAKGGQQTVALRTGSWHSDVVLSVDIGGSGGLYGAGGNGGRGADSWSDAGSTNGSSGGNGTSALGIDHSTTVNILGGRIRCGFGGGGGGAGARQKDPGADRSACGGGGGGGAGLPAGDGGPGGRRFSGGADEVATGNSGGAGQLEENGEGGSGGNNHGEAIGGNGGRGGDPFESAQNGNGGRFLDSGQGSAGSNGAAIRRSGGYSISISNAGSLSGSVGDFGVA